jgi:hypothetical protein
MSAKQRIRTATEIIVRELLTQCTPTQQERFAEIWSYPFPNKDPITAMTDKQLSDSIELIERTLKQNGSGEL